MLRSLVTSAVLALGVLSAGAQTLTMPPEIQKAFDNGTRAADGAPGPHYWQNHGRYAIALTVMPPGTLIQGKESIVYTNNSPDPLSSLNMKLIVNVRRGGLRGGAGDTTAGIKVDEIMIRGARVPWDNNEAVTTNQLVPLSSPLQPHDSLKLDITWHYNLSRRPGREGVIDSTSFYIAYFYPRVSVYDDYRGWDTQPHTGSLEFYNDFNDYDLAVTVPANFVVWSTGTLVNPGEVLQAPIAERLKESFTSDSTIHVATAGEMADKKVTLPNATNTWRWTAGDVSDMALGVSDHYCWDAASVVVDKAGRRVSMQAAFNDSSNDFHHSVQFGRYSLGWFSNNWPGVPYPYVKSTAFQGFADMEYPMMINDSHTPDLGFAELVQDHEQAHTYFPFYMGTNESRYAFMDEGWATTWEYLIGISEKGQKAADDFYKKFRVTRWIHGPHEKENPIITPSPDVTFGAGNNAYGKPSLSYLALKDYLGDKVFKQALHNYMNNWNGKHPIPWDYFNSMSKGAGRDLNWFFYNWFYTPGYIDLSVTSVTKASSKRNTVDIKNIGGFAVPFDVIVTYDDGSEETFHQTPAVWEHDQKETVVTIKTRRAIKSLKLDGGIFMDANENDNVWQAK